jgi:hypothetical protein
MRRSAMIAGAIVAAMVPVSLAAQIPAVSLSPDVRCNR